MRSSKARKTVDNKTANGKRGPIIVTRDLSVAYGNKTALTDVSVDIHRHRITALIGPSGCGKSSFVSCLNRLTDMIPGCKVAGQAELDGEDLLSPNVDVVALRRRVGMIFQKPNPFPMSVRRNIEMPLREHGVRDRQTREEILEGALLDVGLWDEVKDRLSSPAESLSGGQQQRLCIARAIALQPEVLLLDEPCSALDPIASGIVEDLIVSLKDRFTLVIVTHNLSQAKRIADDLAIFWVRDNAGRMIEHGNAKEVFDKPQDSDAKAYLLGQRG